MRKKGICSVLAAVVCLLALGAFTVTAASGSHIKVVSWAVLCCYQRRPNFCCAPPPVVVYWAKKGGVRNETKS
nr:MAG TPA: hypothetical protein [Caudoviricetes sp.]